jgi:hypothetical protein
MNPGRYWRGEESLGRSFWLAYVMGSIVILVLGLVIVAVVGFLLGVPIYSLILIIFLFIGIFNPYYFFGWISVWRCSKNSEKLILATGAKGVVLAHVVTYMYFVAGVPEMVTEFKTINYG